MGRFHHCDALYRIYDYIVMLREEEWRELGELIEARDYPMLKNLKESLRLDSSGIYAGEFNKDRFCHVLVFLSKHHKGSVLIDRLQELGHMQDLYFKEYMRRAKSDMAMLDALVIP